MNIGICGKRGVEPHPLWECHLREILEMTGCELFLDITDVSSWVGDIIDSWDGVSCIQTLLYEKSSDIGQHDLKFFFPEAEIKLKNYFVCNIPHARWGAAYPQFLAAEYAPSERRLSTQLHETLHLFGVDDCYCSITHQSKSSCKDQDCLMRYGISSTLVCDDVLEQIRNFCSGTLLNSSS